MPRLCLWPAPALVLVVGIARRSSPRARIQGIALRTPLLRLPPQPGEPETWLKLETLQPIGSFKIRGAASRSSRAARRIPASRTCSLPDCYSAGTVLRAPRTCTCPRQLQSRGCWY
jgi:hypothetical protein